MTGGSISSDILCRAGALGSSTKLLMVTNSGLLDQNSTKQKQHQQTSHHDIVLRHPRIKDDRVLQKSKKNLNRQSVMINFQTMTRRGIQERERERERESKGLTFKASYPSCFHSCIPITHKTRHFVSFQFYSMIAT